jgi:predicted glutamine amidotransferase
MCLIYCNKLDSTPNYVALENALASNPDGIGTMGWNGSEWIVERHLVTDDHIGLIDKLSGYNRYAIHYRYATHGLVSIANCHPFNLGGGWCMMHNGVLGITPTKPHRSDTWQLAQYLKTIGVSQFTNRQLKAFLPVLKQCIGGDRILIGTSTGRIIRLGNWTEREEGYYSNSGCLYRPTKRVVINSQFTPPNHRDNDYVTGGLWGDNWNTSWDTTKWDTPRWDKWEGE